MTAKNKKIRTARMTWAGAAVAGAGWAAGTHDGAVLWSPSDDITVIGAKLEIMLEKGAAEFDSGVLQCDAGLGNQALRSQGVELLRFEHQRDGFSTTVAATFTEHTADPVAMIDSVMFPEGHGLDVDEMDALYLNLAVNNSMANDHLVAVWATIYFVER